MGGDTTQLIPRIGVVICDCGDKIAGALDTEALCQQVGALPEVVFAARDGFPCSKDGQERLRKAIVDYNLDRVVIAGCTPRLVENLFRQSVDPTGLDPSFLDVIDIREHVAYVHPGDPAALSKAASLIESGIARLSLTRAAPAHLGRVINSALVVGSGLSALTLALALADGDHPVTLVEQSGALGESQLDLQESTRQLISEKSQAVLSNPMIDVLFAAHLLEVRGHPGEYEVRIQHGDQAASYPFGAIVVDNGAQLKSLGGDHWLDRSRVRTQAEFHRELENAAQPGKALEPEKIVMIFCAESTQLERCSRVCCSMGIRQAIHAKQLNPDASVTILFRELYLGEAGEAEFMAARKLGITFFRYRLDQQPAIGERTVDVLDTLTGDAVQVPFDRVVLTAPLVPNSQATGLAALLGLPQDEAGFLVEPRLRLRPGRYTDPGVYVLGSAQQPADTTEALFQAYLTSARVAHFLSQGQISVNAPAASVDPALCTGCGNCPQVCPTLAIQLNKGEGLLSLAKVDELRCTGCGNCVVVCPVKAISLPGWDNLEIPAQITSILKDPPNGGPKILALACEWSAYAAADMAGARRIPYPLNARILRMNCSARFDPYHILWAFLNGADGVFLGACPPGECHYGSGNLCAQERVEKLKSGLAAQGIDPRRLRLEFMSLEDGGKFAQAMTDFDREIRSGIYRG